ncbi:uncharacterized protein LOC135098647 isoform X4 [Scylla paramamosain]|uniref:uncharacterized protein LOC135098647 isoform X4 n=1 Tax=Scylla paramamosain TaxID=85552 RepID=UPI003083B61D
MPYTPFVYDVYDSGKSGGYYMAHSYPPAPPSPMQGSPPSPEDPAPTIRQNACMGMDTCLPRRGPLGPMGEGACLPHPHP